MTRRNDRGACPSNGLCRAAILGALLACSLAARPAAGAPEDEALRLNNEGVGFLNRGDRAAAISRFTAARRILPKNEAVAKNLAAAYLDEAGQCTARGKLDDAVNWLDQAAAVGSGDAAVRNNLAAGYNDAAMAFMRGGKFVDAASLLGTAVGLKPESAVLRGNLGTVLYRDNRREEALGEFRRVLDRDPDNAAARKMCGVILYWKGQMQDALTELSASLRLNTADAETASLVKKIEREYQVEKEFAVDQQANFTVSFDGTKDYRIGRAVVDALEEARQKLGADLNFYPIEKIAVVIYTGRQFRDLLDKSKNVGGLYDGKIRVPVGGIDTDRDRENLRRVLIHEYAHGAVHFLTHNRCPLWLNEGIAEYLSAGWDGSKDPMLRGALERGTLIPFSRLSGAMKDPSSPRVGLAYAQALSVIATIVDRSGMYTLRRILDFLDSGDDLNSALQKTIALDLEGIEESWTGTLRDRFGIRL